MKVVVFFALQEHCVVAALQGRNVYNRRCQPPESKHINVKPQRGVTELWSNAPLGLKGSADAFSAG